MKVTLPAPPYVNFLGGRERVDARGLSRHGRNIFAILPRSIARKSPNWASSAASYVQLDEVPLAMMEDEKVNATIRKLGEDPDKLIDAYIDTIADAVRDKPAGMTIGMHLCRGNYKGRWLADGGYGRVAERVFNIPGIDIFLMEYDSPRAGDFSPLKHLPKGKTVILGLISSKSAKLEDKDTIKRA